MRNAERFPEQHPRAYILNSGAVIVIVDIHQRKDQNLGNQNKGDTMSITDWIALEMGAIILVASVVLFWKMSSHP